MPLLDLGADVVAKTKAKASVANAKWGAVKTLLNVTKLDAANIQDLAITTALLADASVTTPKLAPGISFPASAVSGLAFPVSALPASPVDGQVCVFDADPVHGTRWLLQYFAGKTFYATIGGGPTGGTFTLTYASQTTTAIAYNAVASTVQAALEALSTLNPGDVTVKLQSTGFGPNYTIEIRQGGTLTGSGAGLTGGSSPTLAVNDATSSHKWRYLGGLPVTEEGGQLGVAINNSSYLTISEGPSVTAPLAGDYIVEQGGYMEVVIGGSSGSHMYLSHTTGGVGANDADAAIAGGGFTTNDGDQIFRRKRKTLASGDILATALRADFGGVFGGSYQSNRRSLSIIPERVG